MTVVSLTARAERLRVDSEAFSPERMEGGEREIARIRLRVGSRAVDLGELFAVRRASGPAAGAGAHGGDGSPELRVQPGDLSLDGVGSEMASGRLVVEGDAGNRVGAGMRGGEIAVEGSCGDWAGAGMKGGLLRISGDAGFRPGGALAGDPRGMEGGTLLIGGSAGDELGAAMRRGLIAVGGDAGARAGFHAIAGTALVLGSVGEAPGLATKRGSLVVYGEAPILPTFRYACVYQPVFLRLYLRHLMERLGFAVPRRFLGGGYRRFAGDFSQLGKGEILVWQES